MARGRRLGTAGRVVDRRQLRAEAKGTRAAEEGFAARVRQLQSWYHEESDRIHRRGGPEMGLRLSKLCQEYEAAQRRLT